MKICENCGKEHDGNYGSGRFCCLKCARSFSTKFDKHEKKVVKCINCGKEIQISKRASGLKQLCDDCKKFFSFDLKYSKNKLKFEKTVKGIKINRKVCKWCGANKGSCKHPEICNHFQIIKTLHKYFGFDISTIGSEKIFDEWFKCKALLEKIYNDNISDEDLNKNFGYKIGRANFLKILHTLDIKTRTSSEAIKRAFLDGHLGNGETINKYKSGWHITWNNKSVYYRSSYELEYAKLLDEQQIDYEMESLRIKYYDSQKQEIRCAIPDFYIPNNNEIVEIKSCWTLDIQNMKDKFISYKELGYNCKCVCDGKIIDI